MSNHPLSDIFIWDASYETGIAVVDQQHRKLVQLINQLANMQARLVETGPLLEIFDELVDYAAYHFQTEEELMRRHGVCSAFQADHIKAHAVFAQQAADARAAASSNAAEVTGQALTFLTKWLIKHILGTDVRMAQEILALEAGLSHAEAEARAIAHMADRHEVLLKAMTELYDTLALRTQEFWHTNHRLQAEIEQRKQTESELRKLSRAVEHSPVSIVITDTDGVIEYVNPKFTLVTGYTLAELKGKTPRVLKSGETPHEEYERLWSLISSGHEWSGEFHNRRKNGQLFWEKASISSISGADGKITHYLAVKEDITDQKLNEEDLQRSLAQLAESLSELQRQANDLTLLNQMNELLQTCLTVDEAYRVIGQMASELRLGAGGALAIALPRQRQMETVAHWGAPASMLAQFDFDACWAIRRGQRHEVPDPNKGLICEHFHEPPKTGFMCLPLVVQGETLGMLHVFTQSECSADQKTRLTQLILTVGEALKLALSNIRLREALREQAIRDSLTGLYNRRHLDDTLDREVARAQREQAPLTLVMADIDHFKKFNDDFGHEAGDLVLAGVAKTIRNSLRQSDIAYRFGGEEILVLMPASTAEEAARRIAGIAEQLRSLAISWQGHSLPTVTLSAGIAALPLHGTRGEALLHAADLALYAAKQAGRNRVEIAHALPN